MKKQYELSLKSLSIVMPILSIFLILIGICMLPVVWWCGLILIGIGVLTLIEFYYIRKYLIKKINNCIS